MHIDTTRTTRSFIDTEGADDPAIVEGLQWVVRMAGQAATKEAAIFVPVLDQVELLGRAIGKREAAVLKRDRQVRAGHITIRIFTARKIPVHFSGAILAVWADDKHLQKLDALGAYALCVVPWTPSNIEVWRRTWTPADLREASDGPPASKPATTTLSPVVVEGMKALTRMVNLSTGLAHPSDHDSAVELFRLLIKAGEQFDPTDVQAWAARAGWQPKDAAELGELAGRLASGCRVKVHDPGHWRPDAVTRWRDRVRSATSS